MIDVWAAFQATLRLTVRSLLCLPTRSKRGGSWLLRRCQTCLPSCRGCAVSECRSYGESEGSYVSRLLCDTQNSFDTNRMIQCVSSDHCLRFLMSNLAMLLFSRLKCGLGHSVRERSEERVAYRMFGRTNLNVLVLLSRVVGLR